MYWLGGIFWWLCWLALAAAGFLLGILYRLAKSKEEWQIIDTTSFEYRLHSLEDYAEEVYEKLKASLKQSADKEEQSFTDKLVTKIIDNLQITIQYLAS